MTRDSPHLLEVGVRWPPETFVGWKLEGLARRGMRVTVASDTVVDPAARLQRVELIRLPGAPRRAPMLRDAAMLLVRGPRRLGRVVRAIRRMPTEQREGRRGRILLARCLRLARLRPDVVQFEWSPAAVVYLPMLHVWDCPVLTACRGSDTSVYPHVPGAEEYAAGLPQVLERVRAAHCVSAWQAGEAIALGLDPGKARVIRPSADLRAFRPPPGRARERGSPLRIVAVGWLRWMKGYEYAVLALRALLDRGVPARLDIIGGSPAGDLGEIGEESRIAHAARDLEVADSVRLHGTVAPAAIVQRLQASDVLLHASVSEGLPAAVIEAMACGLPVVAADCGGVREALTDGVEGFVVPPRDPEAAAEALARLAEHPDLAARMGEAGRRTVEAEFGEERELDEFLALYREVLG